VTPFIHLRASKFPILAGETEELVNAGTYGRALAEYLQAKLTDAGYKAPFFCCEDWGWWVEIKDAPFAFGVCIYSVQQPDNELLDYYVCSGVTSPKAWSWRKFRWLDTTQWSERLHHDLVQLLRADPEIEVLATNLDGPG
jgi:hypothetical protein